MFAFGQDNIIGTDFALQPVKGWLCQSKEAAASLWAQYQRRMSLMEIKLSTSEEHSP